MLGIVLAMGGLPNVYAAPEFSFNVPSQRTHLFAHLTIGLVVPPLLLWAVSSLVAMLVTKEDRAGRPGASQGVLKCDS